MTGFDRTQQVPGSFGDHLSRAIRCSQCSLKKLCLPKQLTAKETEQLERSVERSGLYHPGDLLYRQGMPLEYLYVVRAGSVKSLITAADGSEQIVGFHLPGELLGLDALAQRRYTSSAIALDTTSACPISYERFDHLCSRLPHLHQEVMTEVARNLADDHELLLAIAQKSAEERTATFLLDVSARMKARGLSATEFHLCMPRSDLANYLGIAAATLSRTLTRFERQGLIEVDRRYIRIIAPERLLALTNHCDRCRAIVPDYEPAA